MTLRNFFSSRRSSEPSKAVKTSRPAARASAPPNSTDAHTIRAFGEALNELIEQAGRMGDHVAKMVEVCVPIFLDHDMAAAKRLIQADLETDAQKDALIARTHAILALHQPVASDLRLVLAVEHVAGDLERTADHAKNIAKRALALPKGGNLDPAMRNLMKKLHTSVHGMLVDSLRAFRSADAALAAEVRRRDQEPDAMYDDLFHAAIARIQVDSSEAAADIQALFVGKSLERIGDHATNIAEETEFRARGDIPTATRRP